MPTTQVSKKMRFRESRNCGPRKFEHIWISPVRTRQVPHWELDEFPEFPEVPEFLGSYSLVINDCSSLPFPGYGMALGSTAAHARSRRRQTLRLPCQAAPRRHPAILTASIPTKEWSEYWIEFSPQTSRGSFSAISTPIFASKYALESSRRDLHNALLCTVL